MVRSDERLFKWAVGVALVAGFCIGTVAFPTLRRSIQGHILPSGKSAPTPEMPSFPGTSNYRNGISHSIQAILQEESGIANASRIFEFQNLCASLARTNGARAALREIFAAVRQRPWNDGERARVLEIAILAISTVEAPTDEILIDELRTDSDLAHPIALALPFTTVPKDPTSLAKRLIAVFENAGVSIDPKLARTVLLSSVDASGNLDISSLEAVASLFSDRMPDTQITGAIIVALLQRDSGLAGPFLLARAEHNPRAAAKLAFELKLPLEFFHSFKGTLNSGAEEAFLSELVKELATKSPLYAVDLAAMLKPAELSQENRSALARELLRTSGGQLSSWLASLPASEKTAILNDVGSLLLRENSPQQVELLIEWLHANGNTPVGIEPAILSKALVRASSELPLSLALSLSEKLPAAERRRIEELAYNREMLRHGRGGVAGILSYIEMAPKELRSYLHFAAAAHYVFSSPASAMEVYNASSDPEAKRHIEDLLLNIPELPSVKGEQRAAWIRERLMNPDFQKQPSEGVNVYVKELRRSDPKAAVKFATELPDSILKDDVIRKLSRDWCYSDPAAASEWIVELPPGSARDAALSELIRASRDEPQIAFTNSTGIQDPAQRLQAASAVVDWWRNKDPQVIRDLLGNSRLPPEDKQSLLDLVANPPGDPK